MDGEGQRRRVETTRRLDVCEGLGGERFFLILVLGASRYSSCRGGPCGAKRRAAGWRDGGAVAIGGPLRRLYIV
jgi:hypothetical protein